MILSLSIRDFVLIDRLDIEPGNGFTALTGETGAGKSIILDALALAMGGSVDRGMIRAGCEQASVSAEFAVPARHPVWGVLEAHGVDAKRDEALTLKRIIRRNGPARALVNDQAVSAAVQAELGELLVEIHGQHAASTLMRPSTHRRLLDQFAGNECLLGVCAAAYGDLVAAQEARKAVEEGQKMALEMRAWLEHSVAELDKLGPAAGEAEQLAERRTLLMHSERVSECVAEAEKAMRDAGVENALSKAARAAERICRLPGFAGSSDELPQAARTAAEALERAIIEAGEAASAVSHLESLIEHDTSELDNTEARLFALRAQARKHNTDPESLPGLLETLRARLDIAEAGEDALNKARKAEAAARAVYHQAAEALTAARKAAAKRLGKAIETELKPLKLGRAIIRVCVEPLPEGEGNGFGADRIEFDAETNPGAGFGPLRKIASGGELARFSLALKCALAEAGCAGTLIFDEADQGVGGAVAAAIGERMLRLACNKQVFAVTHSPQVAASADAQWLVEKSTGKPGGKTSGDTRIRGLDEGDRLEEIARMLSGAEVTEEARAAAGRLLEDA